MAGTSLGAEALYRTASREALNFVTTDDLDPLAGPLGQDRALEALRFGARMRHGGYNIFVVALPGARSSEAALAALAEEAARLPAPDDWVYVPDFDNVTTPRALRLPPGWGEGFAERHRALIADLRAILTSLFESDEYRSQRRGYDEALGERIDTAFAAIHQEADRRGVRILQTPHGLQLAVLREGEVLGPEDMAALSPAERGAAEAALGAVARALNDLMEEVPRWEREHEKGVEALNRQFAEVAVREALAPLAREVAELPRAAAYIEALRADIVENVALFVPELGDEGGGGLAGLLGISAGPTHDPAVRYAVNALVSHADGEGAPLIVADHPTLADLVGRVEHRAEHGAITAGIEEIRAGALHRANGGFLLIDAERLMRHPLAWEALKRALTGGVIHIESQAEFMAAQSLVTLTPEPVPLSLKVVLFGEMWTHYALGVEDGEFDELFKVRSEFAFEMHRTAQTEYAYARHLAYLTRDADLRPLDAGAVARVIEEAARLTGDAERLTVISAEIDDLLKEADHFAAEAGASVIQAAHVRAAIAARRERDDLFRSLQHEAIARGYRLIDTDGKAVGQANGLVVRILPHTRFGTPARVTARIRPAPGAQVIDIERHSNLGGRIHTKGVLILSAYLMAHYAANRPLGLSGSITLEQSHGVDGDSASAVELFTLISALADVPLDQGIAVTGSVNQHGEIQAIGGVNEKIEGFFDICAARGLTGKQGAIIPAANKADLMLREDIVAAVRDKRFSIYTIETVDDGLEILTGIKAGSRNARGQFPRGSLNAKVEARMIDLTLAARGLPVPARKKGRWSVF